MATSPSAFSALKAFEAAKSDRAFARMRGSIADKTPMEAVAETGYAGHAGSPTHTATGQKRIRGYNLAKRAEQEGERQAERDAWFAKAASNRAEAAKKRQREISSTAEAFGMLSMKDEDSKPEVPTYLQNMAKKAKFDVKMTKRVEKQRMDEANETSPYRRSTMLSDPRAKKVEGGVEFDLTRKS